MNTQITIAEWAYVWDWYAPELPLTFTALAMGIPVYFFYLKISPFSFKLGNIFKFLKIFCLVCLCKDDDLY